MSETEILEADKVKECIYQRSITRAAALLRAGEIVAIPTDTVYGVAAVATDPNAVSRLYAAKGRSLEKAIPILIADASDLSTVVTDINRLVQRLIARFWPGGLTLILPKSGRISSAVSRTPYVAVRLPDLELAREIIAAVGEPLAVTSANRSGLPCSRTPEDVIAQLGGRVAGVVNGGPCDDIVASTVLDCTTNPPRIARVGAVPVEDLLSFTALG
jgi:L-threonylcarbamoyladenylate synthase